MVKNLNLEFWYSKSVFSWIAVLFSFLVSSMSGFMVVWLTFELLFFLALVVVLSKQVESATLLVFFFVESLGSIFLLFGFFFKINMLIFTVILLKLGLFPFWFWVFRLVEEGEKLVIIFILFFYKMAFLMMVSWYFFPNWEQSAFMFNVFVVFCVLMGFHSSFIFMASLLIFSSLWLILASCSGSVILIQFVVMYLPMLMFLIGQELFSVSWVEICFYLGWPLFPSFLLKLEVISLMLNVYFFFMVVFYFLMVIFLSFFLFRLVSMCSQKPLTVFFLTSWFLFCLFLV